MSTEVVVHEGNTAGNKMGLVVDLNRDLNLTSSNVIAICNKDRGIGSDGLIQIFRATPAEVKDGANFTFEFYNPNGRKSKACGDGILFSAYDLYEQGLHDDRKISFMTEAGIRYTEVREDGRVTANLEAPIFNPKQIPILINKPDALEVKVKIKGELFNFSAVSMGNPHVVVEVDDVDAFDLEKWGPEFETHSLFPEGTNFEIIQVVGRNRIRARVWERGVGITLACGTGACAIGVVSKIKYFTDELVTVEYPGGNLQVEWAGSQEKAAPVFLTARPEYTGVRTFDLDELQ